MRAHSLPQLLKAIRACDECAGHLPLGPRPVLQVGKNARVIVVGQAPGTKVHASGVPWQDDSGEHLRTWMRIENEVFYDPNRVALVPMGFCYPGKGKGGDAPPRPECAPLWHQRIFEQLSEDAIVLLVGQYAQSYYLTETKQRTLTETVRAYRQYLPRYFPLPHPSWRSKLWMEKNPWFAAETLPALRRELQLRLG